MKMKYVKLLPISLLFFVFACSSGGGNSEENSNTDSTAVAEVVEDYSGMREADLSEYGIMATMMVPGENKGKLDIEETSYGSVIIKTGSDFALEIVPFGLTIEEMKMELQEGGVFTIDIVEEQPNYIFYSKGIPDSDVVPEFQFFLNAEINGEIYEIKSMADMELTDPQVRRILKSAKSFKGKDAV